MCFYEDSMHVCMNICVCIYVRVIGRDVCMFMCMLIYVCVHVCMCVHVQFYMKTNVKHSNSDNYTFSSVSASAALLEQQLMTDSLRNENDMEAVSEVDNNLSRDIVLQIYTVN